MTISKLYNQLLQRWSNRKIRLLLLGYCCLISQQAKSLEDPPPTFFQFSKAPLVFSIACLLGLDLIAATLSEGAACKFIHLGKRCQELLSVSIGAFLFTVVFTLLLSNIRNVEFPRVICAGLLGILVADFSSGFVHWLVNKLFDFYLNRKHYRKIN